MTEGLSGLWNMDTQQYKVCQGPGTWTHNNIDMLAGHKGGRGREGGDGREGWTDRWMEAGRDQHHGENNYLFSLSLSSPPTVTNSKGCWRGGRDGQMDRVDGEGNGEGTDRQTHRETDRHTDRQKKYHSHKYSVAFVFLLINTRCQFTVVALRKNF